MYCSGVKRQTDRQAEKGSGGIQGGRREDRQGGAVSYPTHPLAPLPAGQLMPPACRSFIDCEEDVCFPRFLSPPAFYPHSQRFTGLPGAVLEGGRGGGQCTGGKWRTGEGGRGGD